MRKLVHLIDGVVKSGKPFDANFAMKGIAIQYGASRESRRAITAFATQGSLLQKIQTSPYWINKAEGSSILKRIFWINARVGMVTACRRANRGRALDDRGGGCYKVVVVRNPP